jgi:hypothetical protein
MSDLEKKIIGDWVDIREAAKHQYSIIDFFKLAKNEILSIIGELRLSNEQGIAEYKRSSLVGFFRAIEDVKYKSFGLETLAIHTSKIRHLIFVTLIQRLIALGTIQISDKGAEANISAHDIEIPLILRDVLARIKEDPELKKNLTVKNILVQFAVYKKEKETLDKLKSTARNTSAFYNNFKETFERIFASIRKNYALLLNEEASLFTRKNILTMVPIANTGPMLFNQAKLFSQVLTTIDFVLVDKFKIRETLVGLLNKKDHYYSSIDDELKQYEEMIKAKKEPGSGQSALSISNAFNAEVRIVLEKYIEKEYPEEETVE